jgi:hypothetical protein
VVVRSSGGLGSDDLATQRVALELEAMSIVDDAVEDGVGDGRLSCQSDTGSGSGSSAGPGFPPKRQNWRNNVPARADLASTGRHGIRSRVLPAS